MGRCVQTHRKNNNAALRVLTTVKPKAISAGESCNSAPGDAVSPHNDQRWAVPLGDARGASAGRTETKALAHPINRASIRPVLDLNGTWD